MAGSLGDLGGLLRQAQQMQKQVAAKQEELARRRYEGRAGGVVRAVVNGAHELLELHIDPQALADGESEMLEDLIVTAVNEAMRQVEETARKELAAVTGGLGLPGLM